MLFCHISLGDLLDYNHPEVPVKLVSRFEEVVINTDRVWSFCIIAMFVDAFIRSLRFHLPYVLFFVALDAERQIKSIPALAASLVSDFVSSGPGLVRKVGRPYHVIAALRVRATATGCASAPGRLFSSLHFVVAYFGLAQNISQVAVPSEAQYRFLVEFRPFFRIYL